MLPSSGQNLAIVAIGRNEGERLKSCLRSLQGAAQVVVYADSGSADGSAAYARAQGCLVVELDPSRPFSAARARNEGFACLVEHHPKIEFVQFLDGDCDLVEGWFESGLAALQAHREIGIVCGHVREIHPQASVYNQLCDLEWQQQPGLVLSSGGRFLIRREVFSAVGGFRPEVIAAEDDEFCLRVRRLGWSILLVDAEMARHDMAMTHFREWWLRARRTGHAYAHVAALHGQGQERYFIRDCRRIWFWGLLLPTLALALAWPTRAASLAALLGIYVLQFIWVVRYGLRRGWSGPQARIYAFFAVIGKFPMLQGLLAYHWRHLRGHTITIIEYHKAGKSE